MHKISLKPQWTINTGDGRCLPARVIELLTQIHQTGSLAAACAHNHSSYRHAWQLVRESEALLGAPLLVMERGKGSSLTPLAEKLVWADQRIQARLGPTLDSLASELAAEIERVVARDAAILRVHASYGLAINELLERMRDAKARVQHRYVSSLEAVSSLHDQLCGAAGFAVPTGAFENALLEHYAPWLDPTRHYLITVCTRRQGFMVAAGNPLKIYEPYDLTRERVRFINRQRESSTRMLLDCLLERAHIDARHINGYEQGEHTHAAVAAYVASGMADVGFGLEAAARQFRLDFIPVATERYFLLCHEATRQLPCYDAMLEVLRSQAFADAVNGYAGYSVSQPGQCLRLKEAFADFSFRKRTPARR